MLTAAGTKLLDFGLAKHTVGAAGQALSMLATAPGTGTAQGTIIGTLQYMAPEQVQGAPADARTDIFALGTILYEMATGRRAFEAKTQASLIAKILETDVPAVSTLAPLAPPVSRPRRPGLPRKGTGRPLADGSRREDCSCSGFRRRAPGRSWRRRRPCRGGHRVGAVDPRRVACAALVGTALPRSSPRLPPSDACPFRGSRSRTTCTSIPPPTAPNLAGRAAARVQCELKGRQQLFIRDLASTALVGTRRYRGRIFSVLVTR